MPDKASTWVQVGLIIVAIGLGLYVALSPAAVYAPTPRIVLYFMLATVPAVLFGAVASSKFELSLGPFVAMTSGAAAVLLLVLVLLTHLSKPEEKIALYFVYDQRDRAVSLELPDAVTVIPLGSNLTVSPYTDGNAVVIVFPEQVGEVEMRVQHGDATYVGSVGYGGSRSTKLKLGEDLVSSEGSR